MEEKQGSPPCINLKQRFGKRFKICWDECRQGREMDPWLMLIPGKYGHIYPFGEDELAVSVDGHPGVAPRIRRLSCCRVHQDGDRGELTAIFDVADFDRVAKVIRPRRRPRLSAAQRAAMAERMKAVRDLRSKTQKNRQSTGHTRDSSDPADSNVV